MTILVFKEHEDDSCTPTKSKMPAQGAKKKKKKKKKKTSDVRIAANVLLAPRSHQQLK
jgi:hypothetical protein